MTTVRWQYRWDGWLCTLVIKDASLLLPTEPWHISAAGASHVFCQQASGEAVLTVIK